MQKRQAEKAKAAEAARIALEKREWTQPDSQGGEGPTYVLDDVCSLAKVTVGQTIVHMFDCDQDYWLGVVTKKQRGTAWVKFFKDNSEVKCCLNHSDYFTVWAFVQKEESPKERPASEDAANEPSSAGTVLPSNCHVTRHVLATLPACMQPVTFTRYLPDCFYSIRVTI